MKTVFSETYNPVPKNIFDQVSEGRDEAESAVWAHEAAEQIVKKLASLKISVTCPKITIGATTTTVYLTPAEDVRILSFKNIEDDLSMAVGAKCRVIAPVPNTKFVGVEIPTQNRTTVIFSSVAGKGTTEKMKLPVSLGVKTNGDVLGFDLADMPHLLVAGASGQGKSVGLNVIISSLISAMTPETLNLYLIDPKRVEFAPYRPLEATGMLKSVDTEASDAAITLDTLCYEVDLRYEALQAAGARKISDYNKTAAEKMPYIVAVVDEFSDLMMSDDGDTVERSIVKIAQLGRAAGVHLIIATQRPDTTVITGLIKANFPNRIAFRTATSIDSKIILDRGGAQQLVGAGDMLMLYNGELTRAQCAFASDEGTRVEVERYVEEFAIPTAAPEPVEEPEPVKEEKQPELEPKVDPAILEEARIRADNEMFRRKYARPPWEKLWDWLHGN